MLIAILAVWLLGSAAGEGLAAKFLTTLRFLITMPGSEPRVGGFPVLSGRVGQFLIEDDVLFEEALCIASEAQEGRRGGRLPRRPWSDAFC